MVKIMSEITGVLVWKTRSYLKSITLGISYCDIFLLNAPSSVVVATIHCFFQSGSVHLYTLLA